MPTDKLRPDTVETASPLLLCSMCRRRQRRRRRSMTPEYRSAIGRYGGVTRAARASKSGTASALGKRLNEIRWAKTTPEERRKLMAALRARRGAPKKEGGIGHAPSNRLETIVELAQTSIDVPLKR